DTLYMPAAWLLYLLAALFLPVSFFLAIQRYRLYEIDRIINKALVYGALTGVLGAIFAGVLIGLQTIARTITGQDSPLALVASPLLMAALVPPARSRIQRSIDRRFFRSGYDAQKTLAAFSASLRQEISLTELQERLVGVVTETMRPTHVSHWLAAPSGSQISN